MNKRTSQTTPRSTHVIDTDAFTRREASLGGELAVARMARLRTLAADDAGRFEWSLAGGRRRRPAGGSVGLMQLVWRGDLHLSCGRCLAPVHVRLEGERDYRLALTEREAEREDIDDPQYDVLADQKELDVHALLEDEIILALPLAPVHAHCPSSAPG